MDVAILKSLLTAPPGSYDVGMLKPLRKHLTDIKASAELAGDDDIGELTGVMEQAIGVLEDEQTRRLDGFAADAMEDFEKAVKAKREVELRMIDDDRQYNGERRVRDSKAFPGDAGDKWFGGSMERPTLHATRSKTLRYTARFVDMLMGGGDIPISVDPTPAPDPTCFPVYDGTQDIMDLATDAATRMELTIKDQLFEQKFSDVGHKVIISACKYGYGICKGPFVEYRKRRKPKGRNSEIVLDETPIPGLAWVDPWMFYYDMAPNLDEASKAYEVHLLDRRAMMDLKRYPNVIGKNIDLLLEEKDPKPPPNLSAAITTRNRLMNQSETLKDRWSVIEMHGVVDIDTLKNAMGIDWKDEKSLPLVEFWFCNGRAVKWKLSPIECDWRLPYYNFTPFPCDDTIFGYGIPYMGNGGQKIVDGALDATLANASAASGPFMFFKKGNITPMNEEWRVRGLKTFSVLDPTDAPVENSFASVLVTSNVDGNLNLLNQGLDFMDQDILLDQVMQGDMSSEETPSSGLLQHINIQNIFQRMVAARGDDTWFKPMGERWVQWNIQFNKDLTIKGDFDVRGVAASTLVSKDLQIQHTQVLMQLAAQPQNAGYYDNYELNDAYVRMLDIPNRSQILFAKDKAMQNQAQMSQQQQDPTVALKQQELQLKQQELQLKTQEVAFAHQERMAEIARQQAKDQADALGQRGDQTTRVIVAQTQKETALINVAAQKDINVAKLAAIVHKSAQDAETKKFIAQLELADSVNHERSENARTVARMAHEAGQATQAQTVQTLHKAADLHHKNVHKAVDVRSDAIHKAADMRHDRRMQQAEHDHAADMADKAAEQAMPDEGDDNE